MSPWVISGSFALLAVLLFALAPRAEREVWAIPQRCERCKQFKKILHRFERFDNKWRTSQLGNHPLVRAQERLCTECFARACREAIEAHTGRAAVVQAVAESACVGSQDLCFYSLEAMPTIGFSEDDVRVVRGVLPPDCSCGRCGHRAKFRLVDRSIFRKPSEDSAGGYKKPEAAGESLCGSCLGDIVGSNVQQHRPRCKLSILIPENKSQEGIWVPERT